MSFETQVNTKEVIDKRASRKLKDREREQLSHVKKRKPVTQPSQVLFSKTVHDYM